jgi:hypothetical protein
MKQVIDGEIFFEVLEVNGKKMGHAGFRDKENKFGRFMENAVGPGLSSRKVRLTIETLDE